MAFIKKPFVQRCMKCLICFLLIVALSINAIPRPVAASSVAAAITYGFVSAPLVIDAIVQGLGVSSGVGSSDFTKLKNQVYDTLYSLGWIADGLIKVGLATTAGGMNKVYIDQNAVQAVRSVLFDSNSVSVAPRNRSLSVTVSWVSKDSDKTVTISHSASTPVFWVLCHKNSGDTYEYQLYGISDTKLSGYSLSSTGNFYYNRYHAFGPVKTGTVPTGAPIYECKITELSFDLVNVSDVVTSKDLVLSDVGLPSLSIEEAYIDWYSNSINASEDPEENKPMLPIGISGSTIGNNSQSNAQSGNVSDDIIDSIIGSSSDSGSGSVSGTISNTSAIASINSWVRSISESLDSLIDWVISLPASIAEALDIGTIIEWLESLGLSLSEILEWIIALPASIAESIADVISAIFVPSTDYVTTKVEAIESRFAWVTPIVDYIDTIKNEMLGASVPIIYIHLGDTEGSYNIGGTVPFLDMSWYSRYKSSGDAIISGFLWALFLWRLYVKLPSIINGAGGDIGHFTRPGKDYDI